MLDQKLAEAMQRILSRQDERFTLTATLQRLVDDGIGTKCGKSAYFNERDRQAMREWLEAKGFSTELVDMTGMSRAKRLEVTPHEKAGDEAVKRNRISIKALAGQALVIGGQPINLPEESHLDVDWKKIVSQIGHRCIMVVENYENFNRIHQTSFKFPVEYSSPLIVYRGDPNESRIDNVLAFLGDAKLPVLAFVDADLAGVVIATSLPWLVGMVTPDLPTLNQQLSSPQIGRRDLFQDQYPSLQNAIAGISADAPCRIVLDLILKYRSAVVQERWIGRDTCLLTDQDSSDNDLAFNRREPH
ncbi:DUF7281 domain-containing protein [Azospira sp.]|uniref:DUF7281 domain-containing protein n=1 Tax=Azospira sp. TaxID=1872671 RepID=UPI0025601969|nr:hypothetical protein [Azospira sp.]MDK9691443.1 hypothetical protein [Azospira sp.]